MFFFFNLFTNKDLLKPVCATSWAQLQVRSSTCQSATPISRAAQQTGGHTSMLKAAGRGAAQLQLRAEVLQLSTGQGAHVFRKGFLQSLLQISTANRERKELCVCEHYTWSRVAVSQWQESVIKARMKEDTDVATVYGSRNRKGPQRAM